MNNFPSSGAAKLSRARSEFLRQGTVPTGLVDDAIIRSWQRCRASGVDVDGHRNVSPTLNSQELEGLAFQNQVFLDNSKPVMEKLYEHIHGSSSLVILADAAGVVLHSLGDADFIERARQVSLRPGAIWSESVRGTNAIGTALAEKSPVVVHCGEHFATANHFLTCSASPIFDPYGGLLGVLDVSGESRSHHQHTMALVRISAQQIENQMFASGFEGEISLHFHSRPEFIGTLYEAIAVFSQDGRLTAANRSALLHLGLDRYQAGSRTFGELFATPLASLLSQTGPVMHLCTSGGIALFGRVKGIPAVSVYLTPAKEKVLPAVAAEEPPVRGTLAGLGSDSRVQRALERVQKVLGHDIPLLIEGESGTGKELFARAVHNSGPRGKGPFVALNCAAIPEGIIEAELFGYQEGAFTGAKRKGSIGRIRQADGGTLFLDEIGDMPLSLQAHLLRVLQERVVTPLGGGENVPVDIAIICATNRKLRTEIAAGRFREDLYYRLNGLVVSLPRLGEREDRLDLAWNLAREIAGPSRPVRIGAEVLAIIERHPWPGNIRQMHSVLRTAIALLGDEAELTAEHLSEDFLEQYRESLAQVQDAAPQSGQPEPVTLAPVVPTSLDHMELQAIRNALQEHRGNVSAAARNLGISRNTLYRKLQGQSLQNCVN